MLVKPLHNTQNFHLRQARLWGEAAFRVLHPPEPFDAGESYGLGAELYRQAIHWALTAHSTRRREDESYANAAGNSKEDRLVPLDQLVMLTPQSEMRKWAKDDAHFERCVHQLRLVDYTYYTSRNEAECRQACQDLRDFYEAMMATLAPVRRAAERATIRRNLRLLLLAASALVVVALLWRNARSHKFEVDLALNSTWTSSSVYQPELECRSPHQTCKEAKGFFFHTNKETRPWLKLDLQKNRRFSAVEVINRTDCCRERANILTISVSKDGKAWQVVAERSGPFSSFIAEFPEVSARYVKIEIPRRASILHLAGVRVFP